MDQNSARATYNKSYEYVPMRKPNIVKPHPTNVADVADTSTSTTRTSILSPDAPVFIPKGNMSLNQPTVVNYTNNADGTQGLTKDFSNMNVASKISQTWCNSIPEAPARSPIQDRLKVSFSVQNSMNMHPPPSHPLIQNQRHDSNPAVCAQDRLNYSNPIQVTSPVQNRLNVSANRRDLVYENYNQSENDDINQDGNELPEEEKFALDYITHIVSYLNENPGSFDSIATRALSVFKGFGDNQFVLSNSMEIIFNKSIEEQNFRYMGAKLYALLDSINPQENSTFRNLLGCKLTYHQTEIMEYMQNNHYKVRGTTLFLAELYMQLRNDGIRIPQIAQSIVFCMNQLLKKTTPENIKCICLTLKLAGFDLEREYPLDIDKIIDKLRALKHIDNATIRVLENVLDLQKNNWGRSEIQANYVPPPPLSNETFERLGDVPVFYGPDGQVLTEEENNFLEANLPQDNNIEDDIDSDEYDLDPGMDAEMEKAYRDFLKTNPNNVC